MEIKEDVNEIDEIPDVNNDKLFEHDNSPSEDHNLKDLIEKDIDNEYELDM